MTKARYTYVSITLGIREPASVLDRTLGIGEPASLLDSRERYIPRKKGVACETARMRIYMRILTSENWRHPTLTFVFFLSQKGKDARSKPARRWEVWGESSFCL